ncbi:site-2 protease family protein [Rhodocaloribacter litoris]|uniref:site-2 protease family protein n=1 Tax=Rhodocaloribacter litoris TaxID=2558931 RepID=UPI00141E79B0|nr:site-2 protease family protein [Rhodocaloribacter litoris]QXD14313.1 site-2 protease family protein [Rhodocaloribacter litoris]
MSAPTTHTFRQTLLVIVLCLLPILLLVVVLTGHLVLSPWLLLLLLLLCFAGMYYVLARQPGVAEDVAAPPAEQPPADVPEALMLQVIDILYPSKSYQKGGFYFFEGPLSLKPEAAYEALQRRFADSTLVPLLQESENGQPVLVLAPSEALPAPAPRRQHAWLNGLLFLATLATTTWAGAAHQGINLIRDPGQLGAGLPYALALLFILGAHEMGHYLTARRYGMHVSLPYFIPVPFGLGTFGAFIQMKSLAPHRRALFDVAVAGPLAGLVIALPALLIGLRYSTLVPDGAGPSMFMGGADVGSSILLAFLAKAALGEAVLEGHRLILHPVAFAGWLGLLVTALNLIPVGQLDGGHMVHALLGHRTARTVGVVSLVALVLLGLFVWSGLLFWALLIFFLAGTEDAPARNDLTRVPHGRMVLGAAAFVLLLLILLPVPHALYASLGIHCPYT